MHRQYTYIVRKYIIICMCLGSCSAESANEFYIFRQCTYIVFIFIVPKKTKTTDKLSKKSRNKRCFNVFLVVTDYS